MLCAIDKPIERRCPSRESIEFGGGDILTKGIHVAEEVVKSMEVTIKGALLSEGRAVCDLAIMRKVCDNEIWCLQTICIGHLFLPGLHLVETRHSSASYLHLYNYMINFIAFLTYIAT